jgi:putative ABC transport system substrate-binding protein
MKKTWIVILVIAVLAIVGWFAFGSKKAPSKVVRVGVSQITSHIVFDSIKTGIVNGFAKAGYKEGKDITFDFQNAQGDNATNAAIAQKFANGDYNLYMPLGTPSSQALVNLVKSKPIVFAAVTDPLSAGIVKSLEKPGGNVTGTSDITLYKQQLELLKKLAPNVKKVGVVYNPGEANAIYSLGEAKKYGEPMGFQFVTAPANNTGEIMSAAKSIANKVDAFYMLSDNTVVSGQDALIKVAIESKKPLISVDESGVKAGALATLGTNYQMVGERAAEIAVRVLKGENPGVIPVLGVTDADIFINTTTAQKIGITFPQDIMSQAKQTYQ